MDDRLSENAFLYAVAAAILDLEGTDAASSQRFLDALSFHVTHIAHVIPETYVESRNAVEERYDHLLKIQRSLSDKINSMSSSERSLGLRNRRLWEQIYGSLDSPGS